jgi:hypothetical protein
VKIVRAEEESCVNFITKLPNYGKIPHFIIIIKSWSNYVDSATAAVCSQCAVDCWVLPAAGPYLKPKPGLLTKK